MKRTNPDLHPSDSPPRESGAGSSASASHTTAPSTSGIEQKIESALTSVVEPLGYEIVAIELHSFRSKTIRLFIDFLDASKTIGIDDCATVSRAVDEPLEKLASLESPDATVRGWLANGYELEVSSPGIDRPLRREKDFVRFVGREARLSLFRAVTEDEGKNASYVQRNPKQKNFLGEIAGFEEGSILLKVSASMGSAQATIGKTLKKGQKPSKKAVKSAEKELGKVDLVHLPLALVSKANLEPVFDADAESGEAIELDGSEPEENPADEITAASLTTAPLSSRPAKTGSFQKSAVESTAAQKKEKP